MKPIAIITARGGSKRIPHKNIKAFLGKPIIKYSIKACLDSGLFSNVIVSTDDLKIAQIARKSGATVPFMRSKKNSDDYATTADVVIEVLESLAKTQKLPENVCVVYPAAPLITVDHLKKTHNILKSKKKHVVFPVVEFDFPIQFSMTIKRDRIQYVDSKLEKRRSQDLKPHFHDVGMFYWLDVKQFFKQKKIIMKNAGYIELNSLECQDINTKHDWKLAELKYRMLKK
ncbi:MAG: pseudaminic acid cytidylyltransferase [Proteobacteria bacterium]|jgi:pseudaminic acid cytidylyltransferase|nr:pseudaminic acid cytidylyltransferase [Pseudomonadota bacterium]